MGCSSMSDREIKIWNGAEPARLNQDDFDYMLQSLTDLETVVSDIYLLSGETIYVKCDGTTQAVSKRRITKDEIDSVMNQIYMPSAQADLISGKSLDFTYELTVTRSRKERYRVHANSINAGAGRDVAIRINPDKALSLENDLCVPQAVIDAHRATNDGVILVVGATGSGKTTLLAAMLRDRLAKGGAHRERLVTVEAPIEYNLTASDDREGIVTQMEVPRDISSFKMGIRAMMRMNPDGIFVGEIRDAETLSALTEAALSGHYAYATLHSRRASSTFSRVGAWLGESSNKRAVISDLIQSCRLIVHQRLYKKNNGGLVAAIEFVVFNDEVRERMQSVELQHIEAELEKIICESGHTIYNATQSLVEDGLIDKHYLDAIKWEMQDVA